MSFIFSRVLAEESLQASCGEIDAYAPLNLIPTPKRSSSPGKTTEPFLHSRFGMTFEPLTDADGEELLTLWLAGFPARTLVQQEPATVSTASEAASGLKWRGSFAKFDPSESKWKTAQCSLLGGSEEFSETWPRWGTAAIGASFQPLMSEHHIYENGYGYSESVNGEQDARPHKTVADLVVSSVRESNGEIAIIQWSVDGLGIIYEAEVLLEGLPKRELHEGIGAAWCASAPSKETQKRMLRALFLAREIASASQGQEHRKQLPGEFTDTLRKLSQHLALGGETGAWKITLNGESFLRPIPALPICARESGFWQTPVADDAIERVRGKWNSRGEPKLSAEVKQWPTPCASASKGSSPAALTRKNGKDRSNDRIDHAVMASDGGQLNPEWVEWLMGWPIGHTALEPLATARYQEWRQQHSPCSTTQNE